jgi:hypothetical protein
MVLIRQDVSEITLPMLRQESHIAHLSSFNFWLEGGGVQPKVSWKASRPIVTFECPKPYGKLFANLAIQLLMAVSQVDSVAICSACGQSYMPERRPKTTSGDIVQSVKKSLSVTPLLIIGDVKAQQVSRQIHLSSDLRASNLARSSEDVF